jgi:hypothetical protein
MGSSAMTDALWRAGQHIVQLGPRLAWTAGLALACALGPAGLAEEPGRVPGEGASCRASLSLRAIRAGARR